MGQHIRCGKLFDGLSEDAKSEQTLVIEDGIIRFVGAAADAPPLLAFAPSEARETPLDSCGRTNRRFRAKAHAPWSQAARRGVPAGPPYLALSMFMLSC